MSERYQIKERIGQGGLGEVFIATDTQLQREVALKRMKPIEGTSADDLLNEAKVLSALQHPNILTVYDVGRDPNGAFVITELLRGETLEQVIARGALTYDDFRHVVTQSLEGLIAAQAMGLVHRDLKPGNLMVIWHASGKFQLKILDFGLAKISQHASKQTEDQEAGILGSIFFMAPEQFERAPLDGRTDLYAMGCIYYFALTGKYPFTGETAPAVMAAHLQHMLEPLAALRPDLPPWLCDWTMWLINRNPDDRPGDAKQALDAFQQQAAAWDTAMQAAPMAAAAMAALAATPTAGSPADAQMFRGVPARAGTRRIMSGVAVANAAAWEEDETPEPPSSGKPKWLLFLLPTLITAALAGGYWYWKNLNPDTGEKPAATAELPDQLIVPPPVVPAPEKPPEKRAEQKEPPPKSAEVTPSKPQRKPPPPPPVASTSESDTGPGFKLNPKTITIGNETELPPQNAILIGSNARPRTSVKALGHWTNTDTKIAWELMFEQPGQYAVSVLQSTDEAVDGAYRVSLAGQKLDATVVPTGTKNNLVWVDVGSVHVQAPGKQRLEIEPTTIKDKKNGLMNLGGAKLRRP
jgi:hypothetical protein